MELGAQLFTVRDFTQNERDFYRTIEKIAKIGYRTVQISAIGKSIKPERVREICDEFSIKIVLTHSDVNRILYDTEALIEEHEILGCKNIGLGSMPEKYRGSSWVSYFKEDFEEPVEKIAKAGKLFSYHNHHFEFEKIDGTYIMDTLLEAFPPEQMGIILDTYWVQAAGADLYQWIEKLKDRLSCVHLKDMAILKGTPVMAPVLEGNLNFEAILNCLKGTNCEYLLVEQDTCQESPFVCLEKSYRNLAALGYR